MDHSPAPGSPSIRPERCYVPPVIDLRPSSVLLLAALAAGPGCAGGAEQGATPAKAPPDGAARPAAPASPAPRAQEPAQVAAVVLTPERGAPVRVEVELAKSAEERRRGLMYRQNLGPDAGMLFLFEEDEIHSFWMKNTLIPLDMIFIRNDGTVAGVVENAEPKTLSGRSIDVESRHVLEVNGGFARAHGIGAGTRVSYEHLDMTGYDK